MKIDIANFRNMNGNLTTSWAIQSEGSMGSGIASWLDANGQVPLDPFNITSFALSMAVNTLVTGMIVFETLKVFLEVKPTLTERTLGATGGTKLRHIIFIIIESGMALFAIQLVRVVLSCLPLQPSTIIAFSLTMGINQMFNVILTSAHYTYYYFFFYWITFTWLGHHTNNNFGAGLVGIVN